MIDVIDMPEEKEDALSDPNQVYLLYISKIGKYPLLTKEKEQALFNEMNSCFPVLNTLLFNTDQQISLAYELSEQFIEQDRGTVVMLYNEMPRYLESDVLITESRYYHLVLESYLKKPSALQNEDLMSYLAQVKFEVDYLKSLFELQNARKVFSLEQSNTIKQILKKIIRLRNLIINSNLRLTIRIAKGYREGHLKFMDLIQEGNLGLIRGIDKFKHELDYKLSTYASWWIKQAINDALSKKNRNIYLPGAIVNLIYKVKQRLKIDDDVYHISNEDYEFLAPELGISKEKLRKILNSPDAQLSLDAPVVDGDSDLILTDALCNPDEKLLEDSFFESEQVKLISDLLNKLPYRERAILEMRNGLDGSEPKTLEEVGVILGLTRERIRQLEGLSLAKLKSMLSFKGKEAVL